MTKEFKPSDRQPPVLRVGGRGGPMDASHLNWERPKNTGVTLARLMRYVGRNRRVFYLLLICTLVITAAEVLSPLFQQKAIDTISFREGSLGVDFRTMARWLLLLLAVVLGTAALTYLQGVLAARLSQDTIHALRSDLFGKVVRLPISYTDNHRHGDIMSRMTNDVENVSNVVAQSITAMISGVLTLIGALGMMLSYSWLMTLVALVILPLLALASSLLTRFMRKYYVQQQRLLGQLNGQVEEKVTSYKTVVAYGREGDAVEEFSRISGLLCHSSIKAKVWGSIIGPITNFMGNLQYVLLAGFGGYLMISGSGGITIGVIQAMLQYSKKLTHPINMIANQFATILTALAGAERIFEVLDQMDEVDEGTVDFPIHKIQGGLQFSDIQFGYVPGQPVLKHLNLEVKPGQKIAIVGATGSGKSTIVNLLTRFYELDGGHITVDGTDITSIPKTQLRRAIAIVLQDTVLFGDTVGANIAFGRLEASQEEIEAAAETAMASRFIQRLPEGYGTMLSEAGSNLSEGQRQLMAIARAVIANARILILDEATSSVDTRTEMRIQQAMMNLMEGRTSLIIAHRISTIRGADVIVVVKDGMIAELGNHESLLEQKGEYYKLYQKQYAGVQT